MLRRRNNLTLEPANIRVNQRTSKHFITIIITKTRHTRNTNITRRRLIKPNKMQTHRLKLISRLLIRHKVNNRTILKRQRFTLPRPRVIDRPATQRRSRTPLPNMLQHIRLNQPILRAHNTPIHRLNLRIKPFKLTQMLRHKPNIQTLNQRTHHKRRRLPKPIPRSRTNRFRFRIKKTQLRIIPIIQPVTTTTSRRKQLQGIIASRPS